MGNVIKRCVIRYMFVLIGLLLALYSVLLYGIWTDQRWNYNEKEIRVKVNQLIYAIEDNTDSDHSAENNKVSQYSDELPYCIFDQNGQVLESTIGQFEEGRSINLHTIGGQKNYIVPIQLKDAGKAILFIDCSKQISATALHIKMTISLILSGFIAVLVGFLFYIRKQFYDNVLKPVALLHDATCEIQSGNMNQVVPYDYDGEIGALCHDFEKMRDNIAYSYKRELQLREKMNVMYASISHDLKTPLATITGYLENILYDVVEGEEQTKDCVRRMLNKSEVLNKLIDDILEHSRSELNELSIVKREVYVKDYLQTILTGYQKDAQNAHYQFEYDLPDDFIIMLDQDRISEVFQNIIGNAIKYGGENVLIQVSCEQVKKTVAMLRVDIKDNGPGIDAVDLPFVFDVFYRGNKARTQNVPGCGLGLNISRYIIEKHGGKIECDSIAGIGTTISFSIPIL